MSTGPSVQPRCESCGSKIRHNAPYVAYRPLTTGAGPWVIERLCKRCRLWYRDMHLWEIRRTHVLTQMTIPGWRIG